MSEAHVPAPRAGETLYRHGIPVSTAAPGREPPPRYYPLTCICTCGVTVDRRTPGEAWAHRQWRAPGKEGDGDAEVHAERDARTPDPRG